ncbi:MAG: HPF/RaiA family ribosome-associated protein [Actinomycetota bacterium]|nr:HPF/RaiA family ribosome-associated protein [Actinomycetota bacterium]
MSQHDDPATVEASLRLGGGVQMDERAGIVAGWHRLDERLRSFRAGSVDLELTVKERATPSQHTTLEAWIAGEPRLVATSTHADLTQALIEVRDDMIRQVSDAKNRTEPRNNRHLRGTEPG